MKLLGFSILKINAEKLSGKSNELKINTKLDIKDIKEASADSFKIKEDLLSVDFTFSIDYAPDFAKLEIGGKMVLGLEAKKAKEILKDWKEKTIPGDFRAAVFNMVLRKASLKALGIEEDMGLPFHIQFPVFKSEEA